MYDTSRIPNGRKFITISFMYHVIPILQGRLSELTLTLKLYFTHLDISPKNIFYLLLLKTSLNNKLTATINGTAGSQFGK